MAAAEKLLMKQPLDDDGLDNAGQAPEDDTYRKTIITCRRMLLDIASIKVPACTDSNC